MSADHPDELRDAAQWWARLAEALVEVGRRVGRLAEEVARDWPDAAGREWAERTGQVGTGLAREAPVAAEIGAGYAVRATDAATDAATDTDAGVPGWTSGRRPGMRLGGTEAHRVGEERGMRIAEFPEPPR